MEDGLAGQSEEKVRNKMKKLLGVVIVLIILITGGGIGLQMLINQEEARQHVALALKKQTGLELRMEESGFQLFPWPSFHAKAVALMRPGCEPFMTAQAVHADISLLALLHREISFQDFTADGAWFSFYRPARSSHSEGEETSDGVCSSWLPFPLHKAHGDSSQGDTVLNPTSAQKRHTGQRIAARWKVSFEELRLDNARILWRDDTRLSADSLQSAEGASGEISIKTLDFSGLRSQSPWVDVKAVYGQTDFSVRGHVGAFSRIFRPTRQGEGPWLFSVGVGIGAGKTLKNLVLDGTVKEPSRLTGMQLSLQGDWPELKKNQSIGRWIFPNIPWVSLTGLSGVMTLKDIPQTHDASMEVAHSESRSKDEMQHQFARGLESLSYRLSPVMFHLKVQKARFSTSKESKRDIFFSDVLLDAAGPDLPVLTQGTLSWQCTSWFAQLRLGGLNTAIAKLRGNLSVPLPIDFSLQGRAFQDQAAVQEHGENVLTRLKMPQSAEGQAVASLHLNGIWGGGTDHDVGDGANKEQEGGKFSLDGKADRLTLPFSCGQAMPENQQRDKHQIHHLSFKTGFKLVNALPKAKETTDKPQHVSFNTVFSSIEAVSFDDLKLESDELGLQGSALLSFSQKGEGEKHQLKGDIAISHADLDKLTGIISASLPSGEEAHDPDSSEKTTRADMATSLRAVLTRWGWVMTVTGGNISTSGLVYNDLLFKSTLDGALLDNTLKAHWKPLSGESAAATTSSSESAQQNSEKATPEQPMIGATLTAVPYGTDSVRFALKSDGAGEGLFDPASLLAKPFGGSADDLHGLVQIFANLSAQGRSLSDLQHSLTGTFKGVMVDGSINSAVLAPLAGPASSLLKLGHGDVKLRCLVTSLGSDQGQIRLDMLTLQAGRFTLTGQGTADLSEGLLALQLSPQVSFAGNILAVTLAVQGPFTHPNFSSIQLPAASDAPVSEENASKSQRAKEDLCASAVQKIRGEHIGLPLSAPPREDHGADKLLRALGLGH